MIERLKGHSATDEPVAELPRLFPARICLLVVAAAETAGYTLKVTLPCDHEVDEAAGLESALLFRLGLDLELGLLSAGGVVRRHRR